MPYRQVLRPTLGEFIELVTSAHGCTLKTLPGTLIGPKGPATIRYLIRDSRPILPLTGMLDSDRLTATALSNFCRILDLNLEDFDPDPGEPLPH